MASSDPPTAQALRSHLKARLPAYMVPSAFVVLDALPKSATGKIDRAPLADVAMPAAPRNAVEELLKKVFAEVLGHERIGIHEHFFDELGHSSMTVVRVTLFFEHPTIATLAERLSGAAPPSVDSELEERRARAAKRRQVLKRRS